MPVDLWLGRGGCEDIWYLRRTESSFISMEVFQPPYRWDPMVWQSIASLCCLVHSQFCSLSFWAKYLNIYTHIHTYIYIYVYTHMYVTYIYIYIDFFNIIIFPSLLLFLASLVLGMLLSWLIRFQKLKTCRNWSAETFLHCSHYKDHSRQLPSSSFCKHGQECWA